MNDDPHFAPILALLDPLDPPVIREKIQATQDPPYIRPYLSVEYSGPESLAHRSDRAVVWIWLHCVGYNDQAASEVAAAARAVLLDVTPTVAGRSCFPIRFDNGRPPQVDESTGRLVVDQLDIYRLESVPS